jgi:hypothetical protein
MFTETRFEITTIALFMLLLGVSTVILQQPQQVDYKYFVTPKKDISKLTDIERRVYRTCAYIYNDTPKGKATLEMVNFDMFACEAIAARYNVELRSNLTTTMYKPAIKFFKRQLENEPNLVEG